MSTLSWIEDSALDECIQDLLTKVDTAKQKGIESVRANIQDPFLLLLLAYAYSADDSQRLEMLQPIASLSSSISSAVGKFHQSVLSRTRDFIDHDAGYDIESKSRKIFAEIKNKHNTMNASNREAVISSLRTAMRMKPDYTGYLVIIIPKHRQRYSNQLDKRLYEVDGASFYEIATREKTALNDLHEVLAERLCRKSPDILDYCRKVFATSIPE